MTLNGISTFITKNKNNTKLSAFVRLAYQRQDREKKSKAILENYKFEKKEAEKVVKFISLFRHVKGAKAGQYIELEKWQLAILYILFGWRRKSDGRRRFTYAYIEIAKKNGKTILGALIALYCYLCEGEKGAEVYCLAKQQKQAAIAFDTARGLVRSSPPLLEKLDVRETAIVPKNNINYAVFRAVSKEYGAQDGANPYVILLDEYHALDHNKLLETYLSGQAARKQPLTIVITTAGTNLSSPCFAKREEMVALLQGEQVRDEDFAIIYSIDKGDDWTIPENWKKANPNLNVSVEEDFLRKRVEIAKTTPQEKNDILTKNLNMWRYSSNEWIGLAEWDKLREKKPLTELRGRECTVGVDMSHTQDMTSVCYCAHPVEDDPFYRLYWENWLPCADIEMKEKQHRVPYKQWEEQGHLIIERSGTISGEKVARKIIEKREENELNIIRVAYDPYGSLHLNEELEANGFTVIAARQISSVFSPLINLFESMTKEKKYRQDGSPVLRYMLQCVEVFTRNDIKMLRKPDRFRSNKRIDGIVTAIIALGFAVAGASEQAEEELQAEDFMPFLI